MKRYLIVLLILAALLTGCTAKADNKNSGPQHSDVLTGPKKDDLGGELSPGEDFRKFSDTDIIVSFNSAPSEAQIQEIEELCTGKLDNLMMDTIAVIRFEAKTTKEILTLVEKLNSLDYVKNAEPDYIIELPDCSKGPC